MLILDQIAFDNLTSDPSVLEEGMMWYRSDLKMFRKYVNGTVESIEDKNITVGSITTSSSHTGDTNITLLGYITIPANTYQNGDIFDVYCLTGKATANSDTTRLYLNTTNALDGSEILIATRTSSSFQKGFSRYFGVRTGSMIGNPSPSASGSDSSMIAGNVTTANRTISIDFTVDQYLLITTKLTNTADVNVLDFAYLKRYRP